MNEKNQTENTQPADQLPDRLSSDPKSPYYNAELLARGEDASFQNKVHLAMVAKGFGEETNQD